MKATTRHRQDASAPVHPPLLLVGTIAPLVAIVIVAMLGSPAAAMAIGGVWAATCGVLIPARLHSRKVPD
jgi:hypothetical protein